MSQSKVAIVTGAGSGVGRATAILLAAEGYRVALVGRTLAKLQETADTIARETPGAVTETFVVDLEKPDQTRALPDKVIQKLGRIDALANIAGQAPLTTIEKITPESWAACMEANLGYVVQLTASAWPHLTRHKPAVIVNVSSMAAFDPFPGFAIYAPAKAGLNMFTHCTAMEGKRAGVQAVAIAPGAIETPMLRANFNEKMLPLEKTLDPEEVAGLIVDCIVGRHTFTSGQTIQLPSP